MKTSELTGKALNWAVGNAEGLDGWLAPVNYCGKWEHGGPIIEREKIQIKENGCGHWFAKIGKGKWMRGPTPLIAAMRCYVASKLGADVNVPKELP
jgi:hypothetical protein